jgi:hypothetical protein
MTFSHSSRLLLREFVKRHNIARGQLILRTDLEAYFAAHDSRLKPASIAARLSQMTTNDPDRIRYQVHLDGTDDLLFEVDRQHLRLYEPGRDPQPFYRDPEPARPRLP